MMKKDHPSHVSVHIRRPGIRPSLSKSQRIDAFVRKYVPICFSFFIILFLSVPLDIPERNELLLAIIISTVFFWSIYRPASMPAIAVFCLGLLIDLFNFSPPGIVIFIFLVVYGVGVTQRFRLARYNFLLLWTIFSLLAIIVFMLQWILTSVFSLKFMPYSSFLFEIIFAIGFYPLLSILFTWAHRTIANPEQV